MEVITYIVNAEWFQVILKLVLGFALASIIGLERSSWNKPAGFRTHSLVGISAVLVMLCGEYIAQKYGTDPSRIPAQLLSGIGFIGAGTILRDGFNVKGLTTAAGLLAVTCIGLSIGAGYYAGGIIATIIVYFILSYSYKISDKLGHFDIVNLNIKTNKEAEEVLSQIETTLSKYEVDIKHIKIPNEEDTDEKDSNYIIITGQYNRKIFTKNQILSALTLLENVVEIKEE